MCRKQPGIVVGKLCQRCEGKCVVCDSLVSQTTEARICDECNYGTFQVGHLSLDEKSLRNQRMISNRKGSDTFSFYVLLPDSAFNLTFA
ncbi:unnamed protein product [Chondrus crispus]|uniref:Uncharacterized protein n=1 Tax=Chondrus crispus TaxID=2769 RepID=R7Q9S4_CHOCR|nr:unnamed protein product [Chondrus crispus]CDF34508.1 unnamed protein product [Chondrus crispus]|eukprot:XP_005714327.1 unnamed protein product [Chondrus crispus]